MLRFSICFLAIAGAPVLTAEQTSSPQTPPGGYTIKTSANEVLLDVVVRDKKGRRVLDLKPSELLVRDNGVTRPVIGFRLVQGEHSSGDLEASSPAGGAGAAPTERKPLDPLDQVRLVTLVFNRLDLNARTIARTAALDLLRNEFPRNVYMGVLALGDSVQAIQPFTNDLTLLRKAVERATDGSYTEFISDSARIQTQLEQLLGPATAGESVGEQAQAMSDATGGSGGKGPSGDPAGAAMAQMMLNMLQLARTSELAQTGRSAIWGLIDIVSQQYRFPGRKSILFFSPGFGIPQGMEEPWQILVSTANRFNVSFYAIDARGLSTTPLNKEAVSELSDAASASRANVRKGSGIVTPQMAQSTDTAINSGKANGQDTLANLAQSTGGFLIANTNDFRSQLRKVSEDIETYYQLSYDPAIEKYDGSFHKIEVASTRPGLHIQARAGFFALPPSIPGGDVVLAPYELPLMQALRSNPIPRDFRFASAGMHFPTPGLTQTCSIVLDVPVGNLTLRQAGQDAPYEGELAYVILVRKENGEVISKFRGEVPLAATPSQAVEFKDSHFIDHQRVDLAPGRYTIESAVSDETGNKISARKSVFIVPPADSKLSISSIAMVRSIRDASPLMSANDPFLLDGKLITPAVNPSYRKGSPSRSTW